MHLYLYIPALRALVNETEPFRPYSLEILLSRGRLGSLTQVPGDNLAHLFGLRCETPGVLPWAALTYGYDLGAPGNTRWLRADPVHLRADRQRLFLFDSAYLDLSRDEAEALVAGVNDFFAADDLRLYFGCTQRWYLALPPAADIHTWPLSTVRGADIRAFLPYGADALYWHRRLNEIQMLLHSHPVNQAREARGALPVNSLWLWGEGCLTAAPTPRWQQVWHPEDALLGGLTKWAGIPHAMLPTDAVALLAQMTTSEVLVVLPDKYVGGIVGLENDWFKPLLEALRARRLNRLSVDTGQGRYFHLDSHQVRHWWRWRRPWRQWL